MNSIKRLLICLLVFVLIFVANQIYEYNQNLTFSTLEGTKYNLKSNVQKDYLLIYFSLDCGTCTKTIRQVQANTQIEKAFDILLISAEKIQVKYAYILKSTI
jgi:peroxiredoxin